MFAERFLGVETQRVLVAPGQFMQPQADAGEETEGRRQVGRPFARFQHQQPARGLQIAQGAGSLLDVRLQVINRVLILRPPAFRQARDLAGQRRAPPGLELPELFFQGLVQRRVPG